MKDFEDLLLGKRKAVSKPPVKGGKNFVAKVRCEHCHKGWATLKRSLNEAYDCSFCRHEISGEHHDDEPMILGDRDSDD